MSRPRAARPVPLSLRIDAILRDRGGEPGREPLTDAERAYAAAMARAMMRVRDEICGDVPDEKPVPIWEDMPK